jgi:serine/threonine-protein kinase
MSTGDSTLSVLAAAVADCDDVDWDLAEAHAQDQVERRVIQQLRQMARLGATARAQVPTWGRLELRGEVGRGTFGTVYRAWDSRLDIDVALKLLHSPTAPDSSSVAIKEGQLLAQVRHPNVVGVYGADVVDGRAGVWMEFVTGRTLKDILEEHGPLGAHEAALIGRDLCRALAAVHHKGFLHGDIKAQNVMREAGGRTVLMDFGTGIAVAAEDRAVGGTPLYLAPEVIAGERPSERSDLYSLGILLFYLVTGSFPISGDSFEEVCANHDRRTRRFLRDVRPDLPARFVQVVDAAVDLDPAARPRSAGAMEALLDQALMDNVDVRPSIPWRSLIVGGTLVLALASAAWAWRERLPWRSTVAVNRNSVAILPFRNLTPAGEDDEYLSAGITDDLAAHLSMLRDLRVVSGASMRRYVLQTSTEREIGQELAVGAVLRGSVRHQGDRVRIVATLIDSADGSEIWSESFDRDLKDVLTMQSEVSRKIAVALKGQLSLPDEKSLGGGAGRDANAFNLYLRGRYYWGLRTEESLNRAISYFNDALQKDPGYAPAFAGLSDAYTSLGTYGFISRLDAYARAARAAERAIAIDPSLAEAHASLGYAQKNRFEWANAEASFRRAIELKPNYATAHHFYAILLTQRGRRAEAIAEIKRAAALDPASFPINLTVASTLLMARRYDDAIAQYDKVLQLDPTFSLALRGKAAAYMYKGAYADAGAAFTRVSAATPPAAEDQEMKADIAYLAAISGRRADALKTIKELADRYNGAGEGVAGSIAAIYSGLRESEPAFLWLERAYAGRDPELGYLVADPRWDALRGDPRFDDLLRKLKLIE